MKIREYSLLVTILLLGFLFRIYHLNWDGGFHLHPDERAIVLFTLPLQWPTTLTQFFSPASPLNPHFFAYGSFPIYLLKIISSIAGKFNNSLANYDQINLVGRVISALFDTGTILMMFFLAKKISNKPIAFFTALFYAISVLPIQLSHFYAVDTVLTFFTVTTIFCVLHFYSKPTIKTAAIVGIFLGLSLATKISALAILIPIIFALTCDFILLIFKQPHKPHIWFPHIPAFLKKLLFEGCLIGLIANIVFLICEPYAVIDFVTFTVQNNQQYAMTRNAFTFPYTLQYVGKIPYIYELKNIFLWGQGPILATISFFGILFFSYTLLKKDSQEIWAKKFIIFIFFFSYFAVVGKFAIGFMRYMLPLYPFLAFFAALFVYKLSSFITNYLIRTSWYVLVIIFLLLWPVSFITIYNQQNTRIQATNWILENIPPGKTLSTEHWDDGLPMLGQENYTMQTLELYNPESPEKWQKINQELNKTDDILIASNRLYVPLQKLTNCAILPAFQCHRESAQYYKNLFSGQLGFTKVAEFLVQPKIPFLNIFINDQDADESFTVYDHPKVMIFQKI